ncbi:MAG: hypothetical protein ACKOLA_03515 [Spartobacteria bacterium]
MLKLCGARNEKAVGQRDHALLQNGGWLVASDQMIDKNGSRSIFITVNTEYIPFFDDFPIS